MDPCDKDNLIKLNADMTYNVVDAGEQCNPDSNENGVWSLLGSSQIVINGELNEIKSFDGRRLIVEYKTSIANTPIRIKATLAKQ